MDPVALVEQWAQTPVILIVLAGVIALLESLALVGLAVPGVVMLTAAASLAGNAQIPPAALLLSAFIGAVVGDLLSYWLGHAQSQRIHRWWPFDRHPEWLSKGQTFFARHGALSVVLGRFIGPIRPVVPMVAGMMRMPLSRFVFCNVLSALAWAPIYLLPGYYLGRAWQETIRLPPGSELWLSTLLLITLMLAFMFSWLRRCLDRDSRLYRRLLLQMRRHGLTRKLWLVMRERRAGGEVPLASMALAVFAGLAFVLWSWIAIALEKSRALDEAAQRFFAGLDSPFITSASRLLDRMGDALGVTALLLPWLAWFLFQKRYVLVIHWCVALGVLTASNTLLKAAFGRERPNTPEHLIGSFSYPSAHTSTAVLIFGLSAAFMAAGMRSGTRHWPYWLALAASSLMALSRLTFGVHWLSDVIGGALLGLFICALTRTSYHIFARPPAASTQPTPRVTLTVASLGLVCARILWLPAF